MWLAWQLGVRGMEWPARLRLANERETLGRFLDPVSLALVGGNHYRLLPASGLIGAIFVEEDDNWLNNESSHEILAIRPEVFAPLSPFIQKLVDRGDFTMLARLVADHCESSIEFTADRWLGLREQSQARAPELVKMIDSHLTTPEGYDKALAAMKRMLDAHLQPSLDAWLRVHAEQGRYALVFRDIRRESKAPRARPCWRRRLNAVAGSTVPGRSGR